MSKPSNPLQPTDISIGMILVVIGTILFSSKAIVVKYAYQYGAGALELQAMRMLLVLPVYSGILFWLLRKSRGAGLSGKTLWGTIAAGIACYHIASYLDLLGLLYISAGLERVILFCYPAIAVLMSWWFLHERPTKRIGAAVVVSYAGIVLFFYADLRLGGDDLILGSALVFIASILTAWYMVANQNFSRQIGSQRFTCIAMIAACVSMLLHALGAGVTDLSGQANEVYYSAIVIALFCTVIPSFMVSAGIKAIGASRAGIVGAIGPLCTILLSNWLLDDPVTLVHIIAIVLVIIGMRLLR